MKKTALIPFAAIFAAICSLSFAQAPASAPSGSTGECKDGSFTTADARKGACAGHKGVKEWFGAAGTKSTSVAPEGKMGAANPDSEKGAMSQKGTASQQGTASSKGSTANSAASSGEAAPGGGAGKVWVNTASKVYHCPGSHYYGKTKKGEYMTESAAKAAGDRPDHGKACS